MAEEEGKGERKRQKGKRKSKKKEKEAERGRGGGRKREWETDIGQEGCGRWERFSQMRAGWGEIQSEEAQQLSCGRVCTALWPVATPAQKDPKRPSADGRD